MMDSSVLRISGMDGEVRGLDMRFMDVISA